jgi:HAD superfamily hydrolase (TIGR01509 family)
MWPPLKPSDLDLAQPFNLAKDWAPQKTFVYFDIGSVLIDLDWDGFEDTLIALASPAYQSRVQVRSRLQTPEAKDILHRWSTGELGPMGYARGLWKLLGHDGDLSTPEEAHHLIQIKDSSSRIVGPVRPRSLRLVKKLRALGIGVGVLSNAVPWHEADIETTLKLRDVFDLVVFSQDVGYEKPEMGIYACAQELARRHCFYRNGVTAFSGQNIFFVDDLPANVRTAREFGWNASLVCLLNEKLWQEGKISSCSVSEFQQKAMNSKNLLFGDAAAQKVVELFSLFPLGGQV